MVIPMLRFLKLCSLLVLLACLPAGLSNPAH